MLIKGAADGLPACVLVRARDKMAKPARAAGFPCMMHLIGIAFNGIFSLYNAFLRAQHFV